MAGLLAKLDYLRELDNDFETEWMVHEFQDAFPLIESFAASLKNIEVRP